MANKSETQRNFIILTDSPLRGHSMNQFRLKMALQGEKRMLGQSITESIGRQRREDEKTLRREALAQVSKNLLDGTGSEVDIVTFLALVPEFETANIEEEVVFSLDLREDLQKSA